MSFKIILLKNFFYYYYFLFHLVPFVQTAWKSPLFLPQLRQFLAGSFLQMHEPLSGLLDLLEGCSTVQKGKTTTPNQFILSEFMRWRTSNPQASLNVLKEEERLRLQQRALGLLTDSHPGYMDPLLEVYQLSSLRKPLLLAHVFFLQDLCCFKEVWGGSFTSAYQKRVARGRNVQGQRTNVKKRKLYLKKFFNSFNIHFILCQLNSLQFWL